MLPHPSKKWLVSCCDKINLYLQADRLEFRELRWFQADNCIKLIVMSANRDNSPATCRPGAQKGHKTGMAKQC